MEIRILLEEMIAKGIHFQQEGPIVRTRSNFVNGIAQFPVSVTSTR